MILAWHVDFFKIKKNKKSQKWHVAWYGLDTCTFFFKLKKKFKKILKKIKKY